MFFNVFVNVFLCFLMFFQKRVNCCAIRSSSGNPKLEIPLNSAIKVELFFLKRFMCLFL